MKEIEKKDLKLVASEKKKNAEIGILPAKSNPESEEKSPLKKSIWYLKTNFSIPYERARLIRENFPEDQWETMCKARTCLSGWERPRKGAKPAFYYKTYFGTDAAFWLPEDLMPVVRQKPPIKLAISKKNVLASIFALNRSAKRFRDAASDAYDRRSWKAASRCSKKKRQLYSLKDRGILFAVKNLWLSPVEISMPLTVYRGGGYCFHSLLMPKGLDLPISEDWTGQIDAKPKSNSDLRLKDAVFLLERIGEQDQSNFICRSFESRRRVSFDWSWYREEDQELDGDPWDDDDE